DDCLPRIDELNVGGFDVLPRRQPTVPIRPYAVVAAVVPRCIDPGTRSVPFDLGVVVVERSLMIAAGEQVEQSPHDLHVLLRHRPRSISRADSPADPRLQRRGNQMTDYESVEALKASDEYRALGVLGRERLLFETFPELGERHEAETARHLGAALLN